jgi:DNA-binding winged helix-turn-helix (wHTH) protein
MAQKIRYDDLVFDADLTSARRGDLAPIRFTHMERNLLSEFMRNPGRLLSRARLMQALAEHREESSDRSVDFFVSRLRRKLCDNASRPRFIVTRYGEGYIWIATPSETDPAPQAFVVFGPVYGFHASEAAPHLLRQLCGKLDAMLGSGQRVHLSPAWRVQEAEPNAGRFRIETALHRGRPYCMPHSFCTSQVRQIRWNRYASILPMLPTRRSKPPHRF